MVKTRHTVDDDEDSPGVFLSLRNRRSRSDNVSRDHEDEASDDSGVIQFSRKMGKSREANHSRDQEFQPETRSSRRSKRVNYLEDLGVDEFFETKCISRRRGKQSHVMDDLVDNGDEGIRRSSRQRKLVYGTFDQKALDRAIYESKQSKPQTRNQQVKLDVEGVEEERDEEDRDDDDENQDEFTDMYSRVKRKRKLVKRDMYGIPVEEQSEGESDSSDDSSDEEEENEEGEAGAEEEEEEKEKGTTKSYFLRQHKPRTQLYTAPILEPKLKRTPNMFHDDTPDSPVRRRRRQKEPPYMSPARRKVKGSSRRRAAFHGGSSSTSSSSSESSSDEERFQRRKAKSMMRARARCLPMNFDPKDLSQSGVLRDRQKIGSSLADVDPMNIDKSINFDSVGGLGKHIRALKEMIVFPLLYPEIFERFKLSPPRGVLFYGPPGTGKTLVARALANECSSGDRRVAFYMRKGADCLSKWVGESERQLRLLFDQAYQTRPSIIFFDEIDGLAPVRSSRQDQIHSSIVSTLLALMDGLDSRGEIVVIGATNRIDSIDPALRRPGRFDREFLFPLPSLQARAQILKIVTKDWNPKLSEKFVTEVAEKCIGYCGADVKALCTEAALLALRRRYPQIYTSTEKLQIDVSTISVVAKDFFGGMQNVVPTSQRSLTSPARALAVRVEPLLKLIFQRALSVLNEMFPSVLAQLSSLDAPSSKEHGKGGSGDMGDVDLVSDEEEGQPCIFEQKDKRRKRVPEQTQKPFLSFTSYAYQHPSTHRPRLLLDGESDQGQTSHLGPAILHHLEQLPVHTLDLPSLFAVSARTPEESCAQIFREARRTSPSVIYLPHINQWWNVLGDTVRATLLTLIQDLDPATPLLLLATSEESHAQLDNTLQDLFDVYSGEVITMRNPNSQERREFFKDLLLSQATKPPSQKRTAAQRMLEVLPKAPPPEPRKLTDRELSVLYEQEEATLRELRLFLRDVLNKLGRDRKFSIFTKPVDIEEVPDYYDIIKRPMDLATMMSKIDLHQYQCVRDVLDDINLICANALEYNPDKDAQSRVIRHRACALKDTAYAIVKVELDPDFEKQCFDIVESRKRRGEISSKMAPQYYHTKPLSQGLEHTVAVTRTRPLPADPNVRVSKRLRGMEVDELPPLDVVEKTARIERSLSRSPQKEHAEVTPQGKPTIVMPPFSSKSSAEVKKYQESDKKTSAKTSASSSINRSHPKPKSVWGRSSYSKRKKRKRKLDALFDDSQDVSVVTEDTDDEDERAEEDSDMEIELSSRVHSPKHETPVRSHRSEPVTNCLSVDTNLREVSSSQKSPPLDSLKYPRTDCQSSPRSEEQKSPRQESLRSVRLDTCQRSPRHESSQKSPRAHDSQSSHVEHGQKSPKSVISTPKSSRAAEPVCVSTTPADSKHKDSNTSTVVQPLVNGFDSGIGSSDSNGDSNDSTEQAKAALAAALSEPLASTSTHQDAEQSQPTVSAEQGTAVAGASSEQEPEEETSPTFRVTRARIQTKQQQRALQLLEEELEPVVVDRERLVSLLDNTVTLTHNYTVGKLEKLHSIYSQCIYQHRLAFNKTQLIEDMERKLRLFTTTTAEQSRSGRAHAVL